MNDQQAIQLAGVTTDDQLLSGAKAMTIAKARQIVQLFAEVTTSQKVEDFLSGFTDDCIVCIPPTPMIVGKGVELWEMRGEQIARWDCVSDVFAGDPWGA